MIKRTKIRSNGITFLYEQEPSAGSVTAALFFKAGVLWEKPREYGVARFVAQLLLRAVSDGAPRDLTFSLRCGRDHTAFLCTAPQERAGEAVAALAHLFDAPPFDAASVEEARHDLLRMIAAYTPTKADEDERFYFARESYAVPLCGTAKSVAALTAERLEQWRGLRFIPSNACCVLAGGFSDSRIKEIEAFLRELPARKQKANIKPLFPEDQFFRTSASDRLIPTNGDGAAVTLLFDVDLCETGPVYADLLRLLLTDPVKGAVCAAMRKHLPTGSVEGALRLYTGFAALAINCETPSDRIADCVAAMIDAIAERKEKLTEEQAVFFFSRYRNNLLYRRGDVADTAYDIGLHNFILYTDDIALPENCSADAVMEKLLDAADHVLIPDNATFLLYYNEKLAAPDVLRQSLAAARIRLFV